MNPPDGEPSPTEIRALELGSGWLPEEGGGLNRYFYDLLGRLGTVNVSASGLVTGSAAVAKGSDARVAAFAPVTARFATRLWAQRRAVGETLAARQFDLVAAHFAPYAWAALGPMGKLPLVVHFHGPWAGESRVEGAGALSCRTKAWIEKAVYRRAGRLIVLSEAFAGVLHDEYGIRRELIRVVPGGVDTGRFHVPEQKSAARERLGWPADRTVVLCVRRLVRRMGLENLIAAAALVRQRIPDVLFLIAGKGPLTPTLSSRIDESGLSGHVRLLGFVPDADLPLAYRAADLSVVPSIALEGFGLTAVESLASGTPVVSSRVGGLSEVIGPLSPDLLMADLRPEAMAEVMTAAIQNRVDVPSPERCRQYASTFDWKVVTRKIRKVYDEALS